MARSVRIFGEAPFSAFSDHLLEELKQEVKSEDPDFTLNVNETEYIEHLLSRFSLDPIVFYMNQVTADASEEMIRAGRFPPGFFVTPGHSYPRQVFRFHVPFSGTEELLTCAPSPRLATVYELGVEDGAVCFDLVDFAGDGERVKHEKDEILKVLQTNASYLTENVAAHNATLRGRIQAVVQDRKAQILKQRQVAASIGIPIRRAASVPSTFAVPAVIRRKITPKPQASAGTFVPDPRLDDSVYQEILQVIQDTGRVFERLPSTYAGKDEESLRDHLILQLEPRFEGSTTGETFNKSGKTDILMRYEGKNVFVAECKFWRGKKAHFEALDQILSYLTWRDSKTALVYFMDTKEMSGPLKSIEESTPEHPCFVAARGKRAESWFDYEFHLPGDNGRSVQLAILCFHLPPTEVK